MAGATTYCTAAVIAVDSIGERNLADSILVGRMAIDIKPTASVVRPIPKKSHYQSLKWNKPWRRKSPNAEGAPMAWPITMPTSMLLTARPVWSGGMNRVT